MQAQGGYRLYRLPGSRRGVAAPGQAGRAANRDRTPLQVVAGTPRGALRGGAGRHRIGCPARRDRADGCTLDRLAVPRGYRRERPHLAYAAGGVGGSARRAHGIGCGSDGSLLEQHRQVDRPGTLRLRDLGRDRQSPGTETQAIRERETQTGGPSADDHCRAVDDSAQCVTVDNTGTRR